ncbi:MAG: biotin--[acetyl-CoA-carboxylase] ligase [bacterium]|nr:biotin--[acetyl-CoA-carboxylase] ligase [bacterium]MDD5353627.1 biotin--[acetyl-CoA-carboxylase] ligase [bacterium]MDD5756507.1 biotin--[acetyl-CoA-carboxylase] ligase [bacterium]
MQDDVLGLLRKQTGTYMSGEAMAAKLGVSRIAIWKQIQSLKKHGYDISALKKNGYILRSSPDLMLPTEIKAGLQAKMFCPKIYYFPSIDSTNNFAKKLAQSGAPEGTLVLAEMQTQGKGRLGRSWFSPAGGSICFSLVLRPEVLPAYAQRFTLMAGIAVAAAIKKVCGAAIQLKWPNDLVIAGKGTYLKVGGILTEMGAESDRVNYLVTGIGLNVNIDKNKFPAELRSKVTSLKAQVPGNLPVVRVKLLQQILLELERYYKRFLAGDWKNIVHEYRSFEILAGKNVKIRQGEEIISGKVIEIDAEGRLVLKSKNQVFRVIAGEVTLQKNNFKL